MNKDLPYPPAAKKNGHTLYGVNCLLLVGYHTIPTVAVKKKKSDETKKVLQCTKEEVAKTEFPARIWMWQSLEALR